MQIEVIFDLRKNGNKSIYVESKKLAKSYMSKVPGLDGYSDELP